jgi:ADP-ribose pyrophosphatase YjhB (NUDIX family)
MIRSVNGQPGVLYTKRADHMALHGGEISFPGGHFDNSNSGTGASPPDQTLLDTALREAHEELLSPLPPDQATHQQHEKSSSLLQPPHLTVLGQTSRIPSLNGHRHLFGGTGLFKYHN